MLFVAFAAALAITAAPIQESQAPRGPLTDVGGTPTMTFLVVGDTAPQVPRSTIWVWSLYHPAVDLNGTAIDARAERLAIDCANRTMTRTRWENHGGGRLQVAGDANIGPLHAAPGNETERMVAVACGLDYPGRGSGLRFETIEDAIADLR